MDQLRQVWRKSLLLADGSCGIMPLLQVLYCHARAENDKSAASFHLTAFTEHAVSFYHGHLIVRVLPRTRRSPPAIK